MSKPHEDTFIQSKMLISRNEKYFMSTEKKVPDYRHSLLMQYSQACEQKGEQSIYTRMPSTEIEWIVQNSYSYFDL